MEEMIELPVASSSSSSSSPALGKDLQRISLDESTPLQEQHRKNDEDGHNEEEEEEDEAKEEEATQHTNIAQKQPSASTILKSSTTSEHPTRHRRSSTSVFLNTNTDEFNSETTTTSDEEEVFGGIACKSRALKNSRGGDDTLCDADNTKRSVGHFLGFHRLGIALWFIVIFIPNTFVIIFFGVLPLGDPDQGIWEEGGVWPQVFVINPFIWAVVGYLNMACYFGCVERERPFRAFVPITIVTYVLEVMVSLPLVQWLGYFQAIGIISMGLCYLSTFTGVILYEYFFVQKRTKAQLAKSLNYLKIAIAIFIHIGILTSYIVAYREVPSSVQPALTFTLAIITFILRKTLLSFTDPYPLEIAMLIAALWAENMDDMFQTLAYPSVTEPINYVYIFIVNFFANVLNLLFLTPQWFRFRVWIKGVLTCKCKNMPSRNDDDLDDDRGHSNNRPGYLRRQIRFYFWKIISQFCASIFYLGISSVLRYGINREYYPLGTDPFDEGDDHENKLLFHDWRNSMIYASSNLLIILASGIIGFVFIKYCLKGAYVHMVEVHGNLLLHNWTYIGLVTVILAHNGIVAVAMIQYHQRIWFS
ncbi:L-cystine transporter [Balamuthia mandrillaris]